VRVEKLMEVERYSHVMHISSTVTGRLAPGLDSWDALRAALPAGTVSGAPKARAARPPWALLRRAPRPARAPRLPRDRCLLRQRAKPRLTTYVRRA